VDLKVSLDHEPPVHSIIGDQAAHLGINNTRGCRECLVGQLDALNELNWRLPVHTAQLRRRVLVPWR